MNIIILLKQYLYTNCPKLASEKLDTSEKLEESILSGSTVRFDGNIDWRAGIPSQTARKWLKCLGYKWKKMQKGVFFDGYKWEDMVEFRKIFLDEMKSL